MGIRTLESEIRYSNQLLLLLLLFFEKIIKILMNILFDLISETKSVERPEDSAVAATWRCGRSMAGRHRPFSLRHRWRYGTQR